MFYSYVKILFCHWDIVSLSNSFIVQLVRKSNYVYGDIYWAIITMKYRMHVKKEVTHQNVTKCYRKDARVHIKWNAIRHENYVIMMRNT